jgi:hypothetical protein
MCTSTISFAFGHDADAGIDFEEHGLPNTLTFRSGDGRQVVTVSLSESQIEKLNTLIWVRDMERIHQCGEGCQCERCEPALSPFKR